MGLLDLFRKRSDERPTNDSEPEYTAPHFQHNGLNKVIIPIDERLPELTPSTDGLYVHEILVLSYAETFKLDQTEFQGFWWYDYGIKDVHSILLSLRERGFVADGDVSTAVSSSKVPEIKAFLKTAGLKTTGKKEDLVARTLSEATREEVERAFPGRTYVLTDKGAHVLYLNKAVIEAHKDPGLQIWDLTSDEMDRPPKTIEERLADLSKEYLYFVGRSDYGLARNIKFMMAEELADEGRYTEAIDTLCAVLSIDLSGVANQYQESIYMRSAMFFFPYGDTCLRIPPGIIKRLVKYQKKIDASDDMLNRILLNGFNRYSDITPHRVFTPEECVQLVELKIENNGAGMSAIFETAKERFYAKYPTAWRNE